MKIPVTKWHGDVSEAMRRRGRERPEGIILITPESLEALFVRRPEYIRRMFEKLAFVLIDELHVFLASDRGVHLSSLLKRLEIQGNTVTDEGVARLKKALPELTVIR